MHPDPLFSTFHEPPPPWTEAGRNELHSWCAAALDGPPVRYDERADVWHVFHHEPVREFLRDATGWSTAKRMERVPPEQRMVRLLTSEPPAHTDLRNHFSRAYRPRRIAGMEPRIRERVVTMLDELFDSGTFDVVADLAAPLTRAVVGDVIGVPGDDLEACAQRAIRDPLGTVVDDEDGDQHIVLWMGAGEPENNRHFNEYFRDLLERRRLEPQDDLVSDLARMELPLDERDGQLNLGALLDEQFGAGQNTTVHLIATLLGELAERRDEWLRLRREPELVPSAIEEGLRWHAPLQARPRIAARPHRLAGHDIPEGAVGLAWLQTANLDPAAFSSPMRFDIGRSHDPHMSFGFGEHFCIGASLARLQVRVLLEEWVARVADFETVAARAWLPTFMMRGLLGLPVEVQKQG